MYYKVSKISQPFKNKYRHIIWDVKFKNALVYTF